MRSAIDFAMVTYHPPLNLLRRWPCTLHSHPAQLVAGARDTVAGGTRRGMRVALLHLGNGAASVPSSILGAFSRPVPPPSSYDRRKDVRARAADAGVIRSTARRRRKAAYGACRWLQGLLLRVWGRAASSPPAQAYRGSRHSTILSGAYSPTRGCVSQRRIAAPAARLL